METVGRYMLRTARQFFKEHKALFMKAIIVYAKALPDPIDEEGNTLPNPSGNFKLLAKKNSEVYLRMFCKFLKYSCFREEMVEAGAKIVIDQLEHDPVYEDAFSFLVEEIVEAVLDGRLQPRKQGEPPERMWKEPTPYGNFIGRDFAQYIKGR